MNLAASLGSLNRIFLTVWDTSVSTGSSTSSAASPTVTTSNSFTGLLSTLGVVVFLGVLMFVAYKLSKNMSRRSSMKSLYGGYLEIIERVVIGQDRFIYIVRIKDRVLLLGVTANQITKLDELNADDYPKKSDEQSSSPEKFSSLFKDLLGKPRTSGQNTSSEDRPDE